MRQFQPGWCEKIVKKTTNALPSAPESQIEVWLRRGARGTKLRVVCRGDGGMMMVGKGRWLAGAGRGASVMRGIAP